MVGEVLLTLLMMVMPACGGESTPTEVPDPIPNVSIGVTMNGDGDGRIDVNSGTPWSCTLAQGVVTVSGSGATLAGIRCDWQTYDAGGGGRVNFTAVPGSGSVFGGWSGQCAGTDPSCTVEWLGAPRRVEIPVGAEFLFAPSSLTIEVASELGLLPSQRTQATASYTAARTLQGVEYSWTSSDPEVASISLTGSPATITAVSPGTTEITATTRGITSNTVTVTVVPPEPQPATGVLEGVLFDVDDATPVDSIYLVAGPVAGSTATSVLRTFTGRQDDSGDVIPAGGYRLVGDPGRYAVFTVGVVGKRYISTRGDSADVFANRTDTLDLFATDADYLDMLDTDVGTIQASGGDTISVTFSYRAWNYTPCELCGPSLGIGVDSTALAVYRFDVPGTHPGIGENDVTIEIVLPDDLTQGGTIYATLITTSTSANNIEPGLEQYRNRWRANVQGTTMIPIGTLTVN